MRASAVRFSEFFGASALGEVGDLLRSPIDEATESLRNPAVSSMVTPM